MWTGIFELLRWFKNKCMFHESFWKQIVLAKNKHLDSVDTPNKNVCVLILTFIWHVFVRAVMAKIR